MRIQPRRLAGFVAVLTLSAFLLGLTAGCGGGRGSVSVSGKVTYDGKPLTVGSVSYHPDASKANTGKAILVGPIDAQGQYTLTDAGKPGVPPGWYKVTVTAGVPSNPKDEYSLPKSLIPTKYNEPGQTPLAIEVKAGAASGAYDLTLTK